MTRFGKSLYLNLFCMALRDTLWWQGSSSSFHYSSWLLHIHLSLLNPTQTNKSSGHSTKCLQSDFPSTVQGCIPETKNTEGCAQRPSSACVHSECMFSQNMSNPQTHTALFSGTIEGWEKGPEPQMLLMEVFPKHVSKATAISFLI